MGWEGGGFKTMTPWQNPLSSWDIHHVLQAAYAAPVHFDQLRPVLEYAY